MLELTEIYAKYDVMRMNKAPSWLSRFLNATFNVIPRTWTRFGLDLRTTRKINYIVL